MTSSDLAALGTAGLTLERTIAAGRLSPSYLFEGVDGEDLSDAALVFAAAVLGAGRPASEAARIRRRVREGMHPDVHVLGKDKPTVISVAALTAQLEAAHRTPLEGERQVFVIDPAEAMEPEGVARYLKALEEPPEGTVFVLVATNPERLPATVLSRVRRVRLPPVATDGVAARLVEEGVAQDAARRVARWSGGSVSRARRLVALDAPAHLEALAQAGRGATPVSRAVDDTLSWLERAATDRAEDDTVEGDDRRQHVRVLLGDLLHALAVEAREAAAGRAAPVLGAREAGAALELLTHLGRLSQAVSANVTPAVVLLEVVRILSRS